MFHQLTNGKTLLGEDLYLLLLGRILVFIYAGNPLANRLSRESGATRVIILATALLLIAIVDRVVLALIALLLNDELQAVVRGTASNNDLSDKSQS